MPSESFSVNSAHEALEDMLATMSKNQKMKYFKHFNEISIVITRLAMLASITDRNKEIPMGDK